jgi:hypothetical protein
MVDMLEARVSFYKDVEEDNFTHGCHGGLRPVYSQVIHISFNDKQDLLQQIADWTASHFDVKVSDFMQYVDNEVENNRFNYAQNEDGDGEYMTINEENPNGYYAMYEYRIEVYQPIEYKF